MKAWACRQPPVRDALSSGRIRNHFLKIVACILWGWSSPLLYAATDEIAGGENQPRWHKLRALSPIVFQKHSWITPDGRFHVYDQHWPDRRRASTSHRVPTDLPGISSQRSRIPTGVPTRTARLPVNRLYIAYPTRTKQVALFRLRLPTRRKFLGVRRANRHTR